MYFKTNVALLAFLFCPFAQYVDSDSQLFASYNLWATPDDDEEFSNVVIDFDKSFALDAMALAGLARGGGTLSFTQGTDLDGNPYLTGIPINDCKTDPQEIPVLFLKEGWHKFEGLQGTPSWLISSAIIRADGSSHTVDISTHPWFPTTENITTIFSEAPVVFAEVISESEITPLFAKVSNVEVTSFQLKIDGTNDGKNRKVSFWAMDAVSYPFPGITFTPFVASLGIEGNDIAEFLSPESEGCETQVFVQTPEIETFIILEQEALEELIVKPIDGDCNDLEDSVEASILLLSYSYCNHLLVGDVPFQVPEDYYDVETSSTYTTTNSLTWTLVFSVMFVVGCAGALFYYRRKTDEKNHTS
eukprot:GHVP01063916.1.p2 GENE.GHVP01063916.1~~GHVP01063916.1.p2  ORF type:complete len:360 (+),score=56.98 GHVP01063916.1:3429-4508(+)